MYDLKIWTDGDFGLHVAGESFYQEQIKIAAPSLESLRRAMQGARVLELNDALTRRAQNFLGELKKDLLSRPDGVELGGNWTYVFGEVDYDLIISEGDWL